MQDDGQADGVRFGVHGMAGRKFRDSPALDERVDSLDRQRRPTSASKEPDDSGTRELRARLKGSIRHLTRLERKPLTNGADIGCGVLSSRSA